MADDDGGWSFVSGFFLGAVIGGITGILLAPKPGSETRSELQEQSETWRARAEELSSKIRNQLGPTLDEIRERVGPTVEEVRERVRPAVQEVREKIRPVANRLDSQASSGSSRKNIVEDSWDDTLENTESKNREES